MHVETVSFYQMLGNNLHDRGKLVGCNGIGLGKWLSEGEYRQHRHIGVPLEGAVAFRMARAEHRYLVTKLAKVNEYIALMLG